MPLKLNIKESKALFKKVSTGKIDNESVYNLACSDHSWGNR